MTEAGWSSSVAVEPTVQSVTLACMWYLWQNTRRRSEVANVCDLEQLFNRVQLRWHSLVPFLPVVVRGRFDAAIAALVESEIIMRSSARTVALRWPRLVLLEVGTVPVALEALRTRPVRGASQNRRARAHAIWRADYK